jgi:hypothetical protein
MAHAQTGQVENRIAVPQVHVIVLPVSDVGNDQLHRVRQGIGQVRALTHSKVVENRNPLGQWNQLARHLRADKPAASGQENFAQASLTGMCFH